MTKIRFSLTALVMSLIFVAGATASQAATLRAFVSSTGSDTNAPANCQQTAPCRTFAGAFPTVTAGGELIALDTAGYGPLTNINKAITIATVPGATAFVVVAGGTTGFTVNAGASDLVRIRNINFNGSGAANTTGIRLNSGRLVVRDCTLQQLTIGVDNFARMDLIDSDLHGNGTAVNSTGAGSRFTSPPDATVTAVVRISGGNITFNTLGFKSNGRGYLSEQDLFNIWLFSDGLSGKGTTNVAGNTTYSQCTDPNTPIGNNPCQVVIPTYHSDSAFK